MITVLVKYKEWIEHHPMIPETLEENSKIVEVEKLTDLNQMFTRITDVKVLFVGHDIHNHSSKFHSPIVTCDKL